MAEDTRSTLEAPSPNGLLVGFVGGWLLRLLTAAALAVDAYIHADLAGNYDPVRASISQGDLFRIEAAAASLAALLILVFSARPVWVFAFLVLASALGAILVYRYVDVGAIGPLPNMNEPIWFPEKTTAAVVEAAGTLTALAGLLVSTRWSASRRAGTGL
jgi:hypothetical protein